MNFMVNELSSFYCDFTKDILYCDAKDDKRRRCVQTVYWKSVDALVKLWAPFLCYTTEEIWSHFTNDEAESVHYTSYPAVMNYSDAAELKAKFSELLSIRDEVNKALEIARNEKLIASAQEAEVRIACTEAEEKLLENTLNGAVAQFLIVSSVCYEAGERAALITKARGTKCPRCWNYSEEADADGLCPRCRRVMKAQQ